ncbi:MAG: hypothetical protein J6Y02_09685 [Pseudobutyrivibrio sp.]|nr:hypothetical protein [Pseudobutyrivibrio sp.]
MATINVDDFKPNSHKSKEKDDISSKVKRSVNGSVKVREKSLGSKFRDTFLGEEIKDAKSYIIFDVVVPSIKEMIVDTVENAVEMIFGVGGRTHRRSSGAGKSGEQVSYNAYYKSNKEPSRAVKREDRGAYGYKEIVMGSRGEAEEVIDILMDAVSEYGQVSVADLYEAAGAPTGTWADNKYGWTDLRSAYAKRVRDGYLIVLPKAVALD